MNGCTHPFRGTTDNPAYVICEICGDSLWASAYPMNMSEDACLMMLEAKASFGATLFAAARQRDNPTPTKGRDMEPKHPMQPVSLDSNGTPRFKQNKIVRWLLDEGPFDLDMIASKVGTGQFPNEDQVQLAQLIGYSVGGFGELSYVPDEIYEAASEMADASAALERVMQQISSGAMTEADMKRALADLTLVKHRLAVDDAQDVDEEST